MIKLSKAVTLPPANLVIKNEIVNACFKYGGTKFYRIDDWVIGRGISHGLGAKGTIQAPGLPKSLIKELEDKVESAEGLLILLKTNYGRKAVEQLQEPAAEAAQIAENIRKSAKSRIKDKNIIYKLAVAEYFRDYLDPRIVEYYLSIGKTPEELGPTLIDKDTIIKFFKRIPTAFTLFTLTFYRDYDLEARQVQAHDLNDIMGLSVAIPYMDIIVTESLWRDAILRANLAAPERILDSVREY